MPVCWHPQSDLLSIVCDYCSAHARIVSRRIYVTVRCPSVRLSVCPVYPPLQQRAAVGLLLWARRAGDIDRQRRPPGATAANASSVTLSAGVETRRLDTDLRTLHFQELRVYEYMIITLVIVVGPCSLSYDSVLIAHWFVLNILRVAVCEVKSDGGTSWNVSVSASLTLWVIPEKFVFKF